MDSKYLLHHFFSSTPFYKNEADHKRCLSRTLHHDFISQFSKPYPWPPHYNSAHSTGIPPLFPQASPALKHFFFVPPPYKSSFPDPFAQSPHHDSPPCPMHCRLLPLLFPHPPFQTQIYQANSFGNPQDSIFSKCNPAPKSSQFPFRHTLFSLLRSNLPCLGSTVNIFELGTPLVLYLNSLHPQHRAHCASGDCPAFSEPVPSLAIPFFCPQTSSEVIPGIISIAAPSLFQQTPSCLHPIPFLLTFLQCFSFQLVLNSAIFPFLAHAPPYSLPRSLFFYLITCIP